MSENVLKKEFKERDVNRIRNLVKKDYQATTKVSSGYQEAVQVHEEGEVWEEDGRQWTIKDGIRRNLTKLDSIKELAHLPFVCPSCKETTLDHWLHKKIYRIHGMCYDCLLSYEAALKKAGKYEEYEKALATGNLKTFAKDLEGWLKDLLYSSEISVTEDGDVESWENSPKYRDGILEKLQQYLDKVAKL